LTGSFGAWLKTFRALHARARAGALPDGELAGCRAQRDELAKALLAAQQIMLKGGESPRRQLRAARAVQLVLDLPQEKVRALTLDVSAGGFGALLPKPLTPGDQLRCTLRLPGQEPVAGVVRVVDVKVQPGNARAAFAWVNLPAADAERLEMLVFDTVLDQLA
jgi:hypothetical protein